MYVTLGRRTCHPHWIEAATAVGPVAVASTVADVPI